MRLHQFLPIILLFASTLHAAPLNSLNPRGTVRGVFRNAERALSILQAKRVTFILPDGQKARPHDDLTTLHGTELSKPSHGEEPSQPPPLPPAESGKRLSEDIPEEQPGQAKRPRTR